jgi:hypothetical protein
MDAVERTEAMDKRAKETQLIEDIIKKNVLSQSQKVILATNNDLVEQNKPACETQAPSVGFLSRLLGGSGARLQPVAATALEGGWEPVAKSDVWEGDSVEAVEIDDVTARNLSGHFANAVLSDEAFSFAKHYKSDRHVDLVDSFSWRAFTILLANHYMTHFWFGGPSISKSRMIRYLETCRCIMINVFMYSAHIAPDIGRQKLTFVPLPCPFCADTRCSSQCSTQALRCARRSRRRRRAQRHRRRSVPASSSALGTIATAHRAS